MSKNRTKSIEALNLYLANLNVLYRKVQNYHWNLIGKDFFEIHVKLEEYYTEINTQIDDVAENILVIGGRPLGTMKDYLNVASIKEAKNEDITSTEALTEVRNGFETMLDLAVAFKEAADSEDNYGTSALADEYISSFEKHLWMLNSFLATESVSAKAKKEAK